MDTLEYVELDSKLRPLGTLLSHQASLYPDREFLVIGEQSWTYKAFDAWVDQIAGSLHALGLRKGDKLAIMLPNCAEFMGLWFACARLGVVEVPVNISYRGPLLRHILEHSDASVAVVDAAYVERIAHEAVGFGKLEHLVLWSREQAPKPAAPIPALSFGEFLALSAPFPAVDVSHTDTVAILYSSGTTGPSKGIVLCHNYFWFGGSKTVKVRGITPDERIYTCLPLFHANAQLLSAMPALVCGATLVLDDHFSASTFWERMRRYRATRFNYIGGMIPILMKQPPSPADRDHSVKNATGAAAPKDMLAAFEARFGVRLIESYGQTENCTAITNPLDAPRAGSVGLPIAGYDCALVNDEDEFVGTGVVGELVFRPRYPHIMMNGYYKNPEATLAQSRNLWFHTGDLMTRDADGYYYFVDRKKDAIRRRGENISAYEVELVVNSHPAVLESAAIAVPSEVGENEVMICVALKPGEQVSPLELIKHCEELMPYFAVPRYVDFRSEFPKTPTHRIEKYRLREQGIPPTAWDREKSGYKLRR
ncbi:AMP-binding protein [Candidimonas humi]|uniref:AMP-binding protein n=1 Tax=Candidimonas humi TaxID=683355 RepID=A0ABV8P3T4_9BURK|nr:AMP-binding protein [Candidimonas humi]MBV6306187.1 AMP-binding protein [Candidimonas humi]